MARPKPNIEETRETILNLAEAQLIKSGGRRLVLSDVAEDMGVSQPYIHGIFAKKSDLVRALAQRWFALVEAEGQKIASSDQEPAKKLRAYLKAIYSCKRRAYDTDPILYGAYLKLAAENMDIVRHHTAILSAQLNNCVAELVDAQKLKSTVALVEDATVTFRNPTMIMTYHDQIDEQRLDAVIDCLLQYLVRD